MRLSDRALLFLLGATTAAAFIAAGIISRGVEHLPQTLGDEGWSMAIFAAIALFPFAAASITPPSRRGIYCLGAAAALFWTMFGLACLVPVGGANIGLGFVGLASPLLIGLGSALIWSIVNRLWPAEP